MQKKLRVAIDDFPPLIIEEADKYTGFEIDLWEAIAGLIKLDFEYEKHAFKEIIPLLAKNEVDVGLSGITINEGREKIIDFSHPILDSGLLISVNKERNSPHFFKSVKNILREGHKAFAEILLGLFIFVVVLGNILWLAEKSADTFDKNYFPGIFESFWLVVVSMTTVGYGDYFPHTWTGKAVATIIIIVGTGSFGVLVGQLSAFLAIKKIKGEINESKDLHNKKVASLEGSTSKETLSQLGAHIIEVPDIAAGYEALKNDAADAIVLDAPVAIYSEKNDKTDSIGIVGELFEKQQYGIALPQGSPLREQINLAILNLQESGKYDSIYKKWFGDDLDMEI